MQKDDGDWMKGSIVFDAEGEKGARKVKDNVESTGRKAYERSGLKNEMCGTR